ncbi:hypothetical protein [Selenomonas sputigena]|uniref:hypothetical protein n=1 Tax=Selenomonas sputigena TaxID=69823 RepID=UPI002234CEDD|nr:hypothetical protein [Selenomonas sputigena]UZE45962.1 hypothetical protein OL236_03270 [Selenomonas sputigena]
MAKAWKTDDEQENTLVAENVETPEEAADVDSSVPNTEAAKESVNLSPKGETADAPKESANLAEKVIYVGPSVRGTMLHTFAVFSDGVPAEYRGHPTLKHLFVAPERLDETRAEIARTGSLRNTCYKRASEEMKSKEAE